MEKRETLQDIAYHCVRFTETAQELIQNSDPDEIPRLSEALDEHLTWLRMLSLTLLPEPKPA